MIWSDVMEYERDLISQKELMEYLDSDSLNRSDDPVGDIEVYVNNMNTNMSQEWHSCMNTHPEKMGEYLVYYRANQFFSYDDFNYAVLPYEHNSFNTRLIGEADLIAWTYLPDPPSESMINNAVQYGNVNIVKNF